MHLLFGSKSVCLLEDTVIDSRLLLDRSANMEGATKETQTSVPSEATTAAKVAVDGENKDDDKEDWEIQRDHHKKLADNAFRCGGFKTAIDEYSKAISLDPDFKVLYSNRSAAYLKNSEKSKALKDAQKVVSLDPKYAKGHSRLAAALHALRRFEKAQDSYQTVLKLDPNNAIAERGVEDCKKELERIKQAHYEQEEKEKKEKEEQEKRRKEAEEKERQEREKAEQDVDEDDLLNDFFADVEEATKKKPVEEEKPKATNAIKNDKSVLGTAESQMERLLKQNFEWRNLNPFFVLQLPVEASDDDINRRYKALSLMLHPDKNGGSERAQQAYDQVKKAKNILKDPDRAKHARALAEEGMKAGELVWKASGKRGQLSDMQEKEAMRIFAQVERKRRDVEERERKYEQRERQQEDDALEKERKSRQFDKKWRETDRVDKRVGNWRDFATKKKQKSNK